MKTRILVYTVLFANLPVSLALLFLVLTTRRAESLEWSLSLLMGHYLFMGIIGSIVGVFVLARLIRVADHFGKSVAVLDVAKSATSQLIEDYNRYRKIKGDGPLEIKPWTDTYER